MALFTPINPGAFVRRGMYDPALEVDNDIAARQRPSDPADLLALFAGISASGRAKPSSSLSFPGDTSVSSLAQTGAWRSIDPERQRYVSRIADQMNRGDTDQRGEVPPRSARMQQLALPGDWSDVFGLQAQQGDGDGITALPAVLRGPSLGRGDDQSVPVMPVQFSGVLRNALRRLITVPSETPNEYQKIGRGVLDPWNSSQAPSARPNDDDDIDRTDSDLPAWLRVSPLSVLGLINEMRRKSDGRKRPDDGNAEDPDAENKNQIAKEEGQQHKEPDEDDESNKLPPVRGPKLEPGLRPGNPGGNSARPKRLDKCLQAAEGDQDDWAKFCGTVPQRKNVINNVVGGGSARAACESKIYESSQNRIGWCQNQYGPDARKGGRNVPSSAFNPLRDPPSKPPRPFDADYPDLDNDESGARLKYDVNGHPLDAGQKIVGRRVVGGADENLSPKGVEALIDRFRDEYPDRWASEWSRYNDRRIERIDGHVGSLSGVGRHIAGWK